MVVSAVGQWIHYGSCGPCDCSPAAFTDGHLHSQTQRHLCCVLGENEHYVFFLLCSSQMLNVRVCVHQMFSNIVTGIRRVLLATLVVSLVSLVILVGGKMVNSRWSSRFPIPWELVLVRKGFCIFLFVIELCLALPVALVDL